MTISYGRPIIQAWKQLVILFGHGRVRAGLLGFLLIPFLGWAMFLPTEWLDLAILDGIRKIEANFITPDPGVVLLGIDTQTLEAAGKRWPWPNADMARLLARVNECAPRMLILDLLFKHPDAPDTQAGDENLAKTIEGSGRVALVSLLEEKLTTRGRELNHVRSIEPFRRSALFEGFVRTIADSDGVFRSFPIRDEKLGLESVALQVLQRLFPDSAATHRMYPEHSLVSFARGGGGIPQHSAAKLLEGGFSPEILRNRIVILGVTAPVMHDFFLTPIGIKPGAMILASSIDTLLRDRIAIRLNNGAWRAGALIFGLLLSLVFSGIPFAARRWERPLAFLVCAVFGIALAVWKGQYPPFGLWLLAWLWMTIIWFSIERFIEFVDFQAIRVEGLAAREIQNRIYPENDWSDKRGFQCRAMAIPCDEVGGDYVDFQQLPDGSLVFIMADVAGHGYSAALITVVAKTCVTLMTRWEVLTTSKLALTMNSLLFDLLKKRRMMTALIGHLNPENGGLSLVFSGHVPGYLVKVDGTVVEVGVGSYPLGMRWELKLKTLELTLEPGETFVLYTDGISEAINWNDAMYGFEAWKENLGRVIPTLGPQAPLEDVLADVRRHAAGRPFNDDVALLLVRRSKPDSLSSANEKNEFCKLS
ncbi:MAG: CHASE2 domain-containing protein [Candidatus Ozemobacteraceae bacterium]